MPGKVAGACGAGYTLGFYCVGFYTLGFYTLGFYCLGFYCLGFYSLGFYTLGFYTLGLYCLGFYTLGEKTKVFSCSFTLIVESNYASLSFKKLKSEEKLCFFANLRRESNTKALSKYKLKSHFAEPTKALSKYKLK